MQAFRKMLFGQRCHALILKIYQPTKQFPKAESSSVTSRMRRVESLMPANSSEGCGCDGNPELKRFLNKALGSACELDYFILLASDLGYSQPDDHAPLAKEILEIHRMLGSFIQRLKA